MKKYLFFILLLVIFVPFITNASWWNPLSWNIFSNFFGGKIIHIATTTSNLGLKKQIGTKEKLKTKIDSKDKIGSSQITKTISGVEANKLCQKAETCPKDKVTIIGRLSLSNSGSYKIYNLDGIALNLEASNLEALKFAEDNYVLKGGDIEVKVSGFLSPSQGMAFPFPKLNDLRPEEITFIRKIDCSHAGGSEDCFNLNYSIKASVAYEKAINSKICVNVKSKIIDDDVEIAQPGPDHMRYNISLNGGTWAIDVGYPHLSGYQNAHCDSLCEISSAGVKLVESCPNGIPKPW